MIHGGDTLSYEKYYEGELVDFSSNINPLGMPEGLEVELIKGFDSLVSYPDIKYRKLKNSISEYLNCSRENIVVGNGAVEIIDNFIMLGDRIITTSPAFAEYSMRAKVHGKELLEVAYNKDFTINLEGIKKELSKGDLIIIGNPNNPTGLRIPKETLLVLYDLVLEKEAYLVLDEAFFEFAPKDYDSVELFKDKDYERVAIIRAATKFFALPGLRLGYACASLNAVEEINKIKLPWSINSLADIAGQFIFNNTSYIEDSISYIDKERKYLLANLRQFNFIKVYDTHTNYILIKLLSHNEDQIFEYFLSQGIVIRKCSSFESLGKNHVRIAIKSRKDNKKLINVFMKINEEGIK